MNQINENIDISIVYVRVIATLLILFHHTIFLYSGWQSNIISDTSFLIDISRLSKYIGLGIFFFISGILISRRCKAIKSSPKEFFIQKFNRLLLPALIVAIPYCVLNNTNYLSTLFGSFLWYLPALFLIMLSTFFVIYGNNKLAVLFVIVLVFYFLTKYITPFFSYCLFYTPAFYCGFFFDKVNNNLSNSYKYIIMISINLLLILTYFSNQLLFLYPIIISPILAIDIYLIFKQFKYITKFCLLINQHSFNIYIFQCFFIIVLYEICNTCNIMWLISILFIYLTTLILCILGSKLYERIKLYTI